jgi:uncharacterized protein YcfJ
MASNPRRLAAALAFAGALGLGACENYDSNTRDRALTGAAVGAAGGAAVGLLTGRPIGKAVQGAGVGAAGGFIYDQVKKAR